MSNSKNVEFKEFAEDADVHGVKQVTRSENGLVCTIYYHSLIKMNTLTN